MRSNKQAVFLEYLKTHTTPSTKEIEDACVVCSARDWLRRLRDKGHNIVIDSDKHIGGVRVVRYRYIPPVPAGELFRVTG